MVIIQEGAITGLQIRAARGAKGWSVNKLAKLTEVAPATIKRYELMDGVPPSRKGHLQTIKAAFEAAGIEFVGTPDDNPGIRIRTNRE